MTQFDFGAMDPTTKNGTELASDLNQLRDAVETMHMGPDRPDYAQAGTMWIDDSGDPEWIIKLFNGEIDPDDLDVDLFVVNKTSGAVSLGSAVEFDLGNFDTTGADEDDVVFFDGAAAAWGTLADITVDLTTDVTGVLPNANLPAAMRLGTDDTTQGSLYLYGDSGTAGGTVRVYNPAGEDTAVEYFQWEADTTLKIGPNTDTDLFVVADTYAQVTTGNLHLGVADTTQGTLSVYGNSTTGGGRALWYNSDSEDATYQYWATESNGSSFILGPTGATTLYTFGDTQLSFTGGTFAAGADNTTRGRIFLYGDSNTLGGTAYFYNGANDDDNYDYFTVQAEIDRLQIGPDDDADMFSFIALNNPATSGRLEATAGGFRAMSHTYTAPASGEGLEMFYDGTGKASIYSINRTGPAYGQLSLGGNVIIIGGSVLGNGPVYLAFDSTIAYVVFPRLTTTQKNALTPSHSGAQIYDTTLGKMCIWTGAAWQTVTSV